MAQCPLLGLQDVGVVAADSVPADDGDTPFVCLAIPDGSAISSSRLTDYCLGGGFLACDRYPSDTDAAPQPAQLQKSRARRALPVATFAAGLASGLLILAAVLLIDDRPAVSDPPQLEAAAAGERTATGSSSSTAINPAAAEQAADTIGSDTPPLDDVAGEPLAAQGATEGSLVSRPAIPSTAEEAEETSEVSTMAEPASSTSDSPATSDPASTGPELAALSVPSVVTWPVATTWTVRAGDTLAAIARDWHTTPQAIATLNGLADLSAIRVGWVLQVPMGYPPPDAVISPASLAALETWTDVIEWRIRPGDSLRAIAAEFGTSIDALIAANWPLHPDHIYIGAILRVPRGFGL